MLNRAFRTVEGLKTETVYTWENALERTGARNNLARAIRACLNAGDQLSPYQGPQAETARRKPSE